ncbi:uncharacterized protein LOC135165736 [Diachasmimorpha longicaudata]|uniref:uncharacterized protein LOC135165736 n=1 Tax=Diachasmimorpha longicaudata TaxID=58733 RepID=UPI0030B88810
MRESRADCHNKNTTPRAATEKLRRRAGEFTQEPKSTMHESLLVRLLSVKTVVHVLPTQVYQTGSRLHRRTDRQEGERIYLQTLLAVFLPLKT